MSASPAPLARMQSVPDVARIVFRMLPAACSVCLCRLRYRFAASPKCRLDCARIPASGGASGWRFGGGISTSCCAGPREPGTCPCNCHRTCPCSRQWTCPPSRPPHGLGLVHVRAEASGAVSIELGQDPDHCTIAVIRTFAGAIGHV